MAGRVAAAVSVERVKDLVAKIAEPQVDYAQFSNDASGNGVRQFEDNAPQFRLFGTKVDFRIWKYGGTITQKWVNCQRVVIELDPLTLSASTRKKTIRAFHLKDDVNKSRGRNFDVTIRWISRFPKDAFEGNGGWLKMVESSCD